MLGAAFAEALGDRAGIRRFGDSSVPMDESRRDGGHRRRRPAVRRDRPAVPRRACRAAPAPARRPRARVVRAHGGRDAPPARHRPQRPPPRRGGVQGARPRAARRVRAGSPPRRASRRRRARSDDRAARRTAARRRRGLRRGQPRVDRAGAAHRRRRRPPARRAATRSAARTCSSCRASGPPRRRWSGCAPAASSSRSRPGSRQDRPFLGICLGLQLLFEGSRRGRRRDAGRAPRPHGPPRGRPDAPAHRLEPGRAPPRAPGLRRASRRTRTSTSSTPTSGAPAAGADDAVLAETEHGAPVRGRGRARPAARRPVPPGALGRRRPAADRERRGARRAAPDRGSAA